MPKYNPNSIWEGKKTESQAPQQKAKVLSRAAAVAAEGAPPAQPALVKKVEIHDEPPARTGRTILWAAVVFAVLAGGGVLYFFIRPTAGPNVSIEFMPAGQVLVGDPFLFDVTLTNYSSNILKNATLSISLPYNVSFIGQDPSQRVMEQTVGDLGPGSINKPYPNLKLIVTGDPNTVKRVTAKLTYSTDANSRAQFETDGGVDILVGGPAISITITPPPSIFSGQNFDFTINYNNNTSHSFNKVELSVQYPPVFTFLRSSMQSDSSGNNSWNMGTIPAAGAGTITVTGNVVGPNNAAYSLVGNLTGQVAGDTYTLSGQTANIAISSSPLSLKITPNNSPDYIASAGDSLDYVISYSNDSNVTFQNVTLKATLVGDMFDFSSLSSNGSLNSITNTVTWYAANTPALLSLAPGQSDSVDLKIRTKSSYPIRLLSDKNYTLKVNGQISSPTVPPGISAASTVSAASIENKVGGRIALAAKGFWRDAASGILNAGPYPPRVNQKTQYTIHWAITNYSTDAQGVTVSAYLQSGTTCTGQVKSNISTSPTCNAASGLVTWTIPNVPATTGITGSAAEAIFQVENTPAVNQVGQSVTLLGPTTLQTTDVFTGTQLQASAGPVTTDLPDDKTVSGISNRRVTQ